MRCRPTSASRSGSKHRDDAGAVDDPGTRTAGRVLARRPAAVGVERRAALHRTPRSISTASASSRAGTNGQQIGQHRDALQAGGLGELREPGAHRQMGHQPRRAQTGTPRTADGRWPTTIDAARAPARLRAVEWPPTRNSSPADGGKVERPRPPSRPAPARPAPRAPRPGRATTPPRTASHRRPRPGPPTDRPTQRPPRAPATPEPHAPSSAVGWAKASARRAVDLLEPCTARRPGGEQPAAGLASHGARFVSSGPTRRSVARYVARDRSSANPDGDEPLDRVRVKHDLDVKRQPLRRRPGRQPGQAPGRPASPRRRSSRPSRSAHVHDERPHRRPRLRVKPRGR